MSDQHSIELFTANTPNGQKASLALEELKAIGAIAGYDVQAITFSKNEQKSDWFLRKCPNGRIPAITDHARGDKNVWETASILLYLGKHYDPKKTFGFEDADEETDMLSWMFWMHGGLGPMQGQAHHFVRYAPEKIPYGIKRYQDETKRLYWTLDQHLQSRDYIAGSGRGKYSWADMSTAPWVRWHYWAGIETLDEYPDLKRWLDSIAKRPAFQEAIKVPEIDPIARMENDPEAVEREAKENAKWVMAGQGKNK